MDPLELIQQGKVKRYFRASRKLNAPGVVFHITQRAAGKEPLFLENSDYLTMVWMLKELAMSHFVDFYAFCLMPNHVHLLCSFKTPNLYDAMRDLFARYAMRFNQKYERKGHLFAGPYRQALCLEEAYVVAASLYIHLNPVKAGLAHSPGLYRWSSCRLYERRPRQESFVVPDFVLGLLSPSLQQSRERYQALLTQGMGIEMRAAGEDKKAVENFLSCIASKVPALWSWLRERSGDQEGAFTTVGERELWEDRIASMKREGLSRKPETRTAWRHAIEQLIARGYKREEIAEKLGISRKTVYNLTRR